MLILDEMIEERRKEQQKASKRGPKKASNADRSMATGRAKRDAATKARRGLTPNKKPNAMDVEREVDRQSRKTAAAKKKSQKKATGGRIAPDSTLRDKKKKKVAGKRDPPAPVFGGRMPSKKAVEAAVKGMEQAGFKVPTGHQVVMTFIPIPQQVAPQPARKSGPQKGGAGGPKGKHDSKPAGRQNKGGGRGGGRRQR